MKRDHYFLVVDHFDLKKFDVINMSFTPLMLEIEPQLFYCKATSNIKAPFRFGYDEVIFFNIPEYMANEIIQFTKETEILFI